MKEESTPRSGETQPQAPSRRSEFIATLILGCAAVLAAWTLFQSAKWSGMQAIAFSEAAAARTEGARLADRADQQRALDVGLFVSWTDAVADELEAQGLPPSEYRPQDDKLSGFLLSRFPPRLATATRAWLKTRPFVDPDAPRTPFELPMYQSAAEIEAAALSDEADMLATRARLYNTRSDNYVAVNIMLAMALFLAGIGTKTTRRRGRRVLLGLAALMVLVAAGLLASFPVQIA